MMAEDFFADNPFCHDLGLKLERWSDGQALISLELLGRHMNRRQVAHGGVLSTLVDMAMSLAWRSAARERRSGGTTHLSTHFVAPASGKLVASGRLLHLGNSLAFCEARVCGPSGEIFVLAQGSFRAIRTTERQFG